MLYLFGGMLALAGLVIATKTQSRLRWYREASRWPTVSGVIVRSVLREDADADGVSFRPEISCKYTVAGSDYVTSSHTEGMRFQHREYDARQMIENFPVGRGIAVHVNPADATQAVFDTGDPHHLRVIQRIGGAALMAGLALIIIRYSFL